MSSEQPKHIVIDGDVQGIVVAGDNNTIVTGSAGFSLSPVQAAPEIPPHAGPASLLNPQFEIVPFVPTNDEEDLILWLNGEGIRAARLISGPGGFGKTRLALRIAQLAEAEGWQSYIATDSTDLPYTEQHDPEIAVDSFKQRAGALFILDYADRWSRSSLNEFFRSVARYQAKIRVLMTARSTLFWSPVAHLIRGFHFSATSGPIRNIASNYDTSLSLHKAARSAFAQHFSLYGNDSTSTQPGLNESTSSTADDRRPKDAKYDHALAIQLRALLEVLDVLGNNPVADSYGNRWEELSSSLIDREINHWTGLSDAPPTPMVPIKTSLFTLFHATIVAITVRGLPLQDAEPLLSRLGFQDCVVVLKDHATIYPSPVRSVYLWPLLPDRIGEDLIARALDGVGDDEFLEGWGGPECDRLILNLLADKSSHQTDAGVIETPNPTVRTVLNVLADAGDRWPHIRTLLASAIESNPIISVFAGGSVVERICPHLSFDTLRSVVHKLGDIAPRSINLDSQLSLETAFEMLIKHPKFDELSAEEKVSDLDAYAELLAEVGKPTRSLELASQATNILWTEILSGKGITSTPMYQLAWAAGVISRYGDRLLSTGDRTSALVQSKSAVYMFQKWIERGGDASDEGYLRVANGYAAVLAQNGDVNQAIQIMRNLVAYLQGDPTQLTGPAKMNLATCLANLGNYLSQIGDIEQARQYLNASGSLRLELAAINPHLYSPDLSATLHNLAALELEAGNYEEAIEIGMSALEMRRKMVENIPGSFLPHLLRSMWVVRNAHIERADYDAALAISVDEIRLLPEVHPDFSEVEASESVHRHVKLHLSLLDMAKRGRERSDWLASLLADPAQIRSGIRTHPWVMLKSTVLPLEQDTDDGRIIVFDPKCWEYTVQTVLKLAKELQTCDPTKMDGKDILIVLRFLMVKETPLEIRETACTMLGRYLRSSSESTPIELGPVAAMLPPILCRWSEDAIQSGNLEEYLSSAEAALPIIYACAELWPETIRESAGALHNGAAYALFISRTYNGVVLARSAVELLSRPGGHSAQETDDMIAGLNTLAEQLRRWEHENHEERLQVTGAAVKLAREAFSRQATVPSATDVAMSLEKLAQALTSTGKVDEALAAGGHALGLRLECAKASGESYLPLLTEGCTTARRILTEAGQDHLVESMWADVRQTLPEELWNDLATRLNIKRESSS
ncbi:tetratricopeptide repeat protein [Nocardia noduli]|uniref:tetratricopeptide repeat protein n=1 Tax=Nocardia noduli TaxID=2815722 RepID=UPI001C2504AC|nr:tetratricopeptide repeat protein [Nocardia noduli]